MLKLDKRGPRRFSRNGGHRIAYPNPSQEEYERCIRLARTSKSLDTLDEIYVWAKNHGVPDVICIAVDRLKKLHPRRRLPTISIPPRKRRRL